MTVRVPILLIHLITELIPLFSTFYNVIKTDVRTIGNIKGALINWIIKMRAWKSLNIGGYSSRNCIK